LAEELGGSHGGAVQVFVWSLVGGNSVFEVGSKMMSLIDRIGEFLKAGLSSPLKTVTTCQIAFWSRFLYLLLFLLYISGSIKRFLAHLGIHSKCKRSSSMVVEQSVIDSRFISNDQIAQKAVRLSKLTRSPHTKLSNDFWVGRAQ
jgi:hypothetical protein